MRATGIVRRIDELGRIVIPKEIRKSLRIKEGTPIEIFMGATEEIVLKKYSQLNELNDLAKESVESVFESIEHATLICDKDEILYGAGVNKTEYINKPISFEIEKIIADRKAVLSNKKDNATMHKLIKNDETVYTSQIIVPINVNGDTVGAMIIFSKEEEVSFKEMEVKVATVLVHFLEKQLD